MLEPLLLSLCLFSNSIACEKTAQAYSRYSGIEKVVEKVGTDYPVLSYAASIAGAIKEQRAVVPLIYSNLFLSYEVNRNDESKNQLLFRVTY
jgi:hypothetical protein